jgi:HK97 family phage major capsid protein
MSLFTAKELAKFSVTKALNKLANCPRPGIPGEATGLEREVSDTLADRLKSLTGNSTLGFLLPIACLKALNVTTATAGGFLVDTDLAAIVPALRSKSVVIDLGATIFENLVGHCGLPIEDTNSTPQWLAEMAELQESDSGYRQALLSPKRCASMATLSRQLLSQNSLGIENFVRGSLLRAVGSALDKDALSGNGNAEPPPIYPRVRIPPSPRLFFIQTALIRWRRLSRPTNPSIACEISAPENARRHLLATIH